MSWLNLNQSLNTLKGQITNFASEVLSEATEQESGDNATALDAPLKELEEKCRIQELEIASLKSLNEELQASLQSELPRLTREGATQRFSGRNGVKEEESSWYWDPAPQPKQVDDTDPYKMQIKALQEELSSLRERDTVDIRQDTDEELNRLREENKNLTTNLEDLDAQHQLAMERLLSLKKELQKNFEVLRQEHEDLKNTNDDYADEIKDLLAKIAEKDKELESITTTKSDYDTLHQKYINLERIHGLLRENAEKFQEENQELHEEVFKLQEQVTKLEHDIETVTKHSETSETVPRDMYEELLKELSELKERRNSNHDHLDEVNIDDNAKSVIETLKRDLNDLRHRLAQKENGDPQTENKVVKSEKIMQLYNKYVNFELPVDYLGEVPTANDNIVIFKLESAFKTLNSFKKDIDTLEHKVSEKDLNISHLHTQIDDLTTENDFLTNDLQHFERELEEMKKNNDFLISEIATSKNTSKLEPIIETHEDNLAKLETELADSNRINKTFESEIKRIQKELMAVQNEKSLLQSSLTDLKEKYTVMLGELDMFKAQTKEVEELENSAYIANEQKQKELTDEICELKKRLIAASTNNEQLSIDVHIIENEKVLLTQEIDNLKQRLNNTSNLHKSQPQVGVDRIIVEKVHLQDNSTQSVHNEDKENDSTKALQELEKATLEKARTLEKLAFVMDENSTLKGSIAKLSAEVNNLKQHEQTLINEINELKNRTHSEGQNANALKETIENLKAKLIQQEMLTGEVAKLQEENAKLIRRKLQLETELSTTDNKIVHLEEEFEKLVFDMGEKDTLIDSLNSTINNNNEQITNLSKIISDLEANIIAKNNEVMSLHKSLADINHKLNEDFRLSNHSHEEILREKEVIGQQLMEVNVEVNKKNAEIIELYKKVEEMEQECIKFKALADEKDKEVVKLQISVSEANKKLNETLQLSNHSQEAIIHDKEAVSQKLVELNFEIKRKDEEIIALNNKIEEGEKKFCQLKALSDDKDKEIKELQQNVIEIRDKLKNVENTSTADDYPILLKDKENLENRVVELLNNITLKERELNDTKLKSEHLEKACLEYKTILDNTTAEKTELINLVNLKHNESLQYHNEIQRLNHVLLEQANEFKKIIEDSNHTQTNDSCQQCETLRMTLREKDEIIMTLNQNNTLFDNYKTDLQNANESLRVLTEKCDALEKNLTLQLDAVKKLTAEKLQLSEQYENATRELERLRHHLVETEESYTQELMTSEQKLTECQARLAHVEERAKQSSTVYTSNSIRANQEVETYKNQIKLLEKQREEVQARLSEAEDAKSRSEAALTNLQVVLEQFQLDKERDIHAATEKIRNKMEDLRKENSALQAEINKLSDKLQESLAGLQAATRLGDQLETKTAQINDLKEQVKTLQTSVGAAEERYYNAISNQQDRVDKNLVKNLVLNFVLADGSSGNKTQVLRVLCSVLDCDQAECARLGLARPPRAAGLAAEFVRFLQDESKPRAALPSMMGLARSTASSSRRSSTIGPSPIPSEGSGHKRNPSTGSNNLLFQNIDNIETSSQVSIESEHRERSTMETGVNQTRNTEGAILKHVLKDM